MNKKTEDKIRNAKFLNYSIREGIYPIKYKNYSIDVEGASFDEKIDIWNDICTFVAVHNARFSKTPRKDNVEIIDYKEYNKPYRV